MIAAPGQGMFTLIDNREVSPAPVSGFATRIRGPGNMNSNRVSVPFKRKLDTSGNLALEKLSLKRAATSTWEENFKLSKKDPMDSVRRPGKAENDTLKVSLTKLLQANGDGTIMPFDDSNSGLS